MAQPARSRIRALFTAVKRAEAGEVARVLDTYPHLLDAVNHWDGRTLLYHAAFFGQTAMVRMLLDRGAGVDTKSRDGLSPLFAAASSGHAEVVLLLLGSGADVRSTNGPESGTALMAACRGGHLGVVRVLLQHMGGEGLDATDGAGCTALYLACSSRRPEVTRALLLAGADQTIVGGGGVNRRTPRQAAVLIGSRACEKVFEWWEVEPKRAYELQRARRVHDDGTNQQQAPGCPVPAYLRQRVEAGESLPTVQLGAGVPSRKRQEGWGDYSEEEKGVMLKYAIQDLGSELFIELLEGFRS